MVSEVTLHIMSVFVRTRAPAQYETSLQTLNSQSETHKHCNWPHVVTGVLKLSSSSSSSRYASLETAKILYLFISLN